MINVIILKDKDRMLKMQTIEKELQEEAGESVVRKRASEIIAQSAASRKGIPGTSTDDGSFHSQPIWHFNSPFSFKLNKHCKYYLETVFNSH